MIVFCKVFSETKAEVMLCPVVGKINADNTEPQVTYNTLCAFRKTHFFIILQRSCTIENMFKPSCYMVEEVQTQKVMKFHECL